MKDRIAHILFYKRLLLTRFRMRFFSSYYSLVFFLNPAISVGKGMRITGRLKLKVDPRAKWIVGDKLRINSGYHVNPFGGHRQTIINVNEKGKLVLGNHVGISSSTIICTDHIVIEDHVMIGGGCHIFDTNFHSIDPKERMNKPGHNIKSKAVLISKGAFIGGGSYITKGVTIGKYAIVAAGSVVTKDIPDHQVWGGNPAVFIKQLSTSLQSV